MEMRMELKQAVAAYQMGNVDAFTQLYEESKNYIYVCVHKIMNGSDNLYYAMCDIMNETYLEISQSIGKLQDEGDAIDNIFDSDEIIPETVLQDREKQRLVKEIIDNELTPIQKICIVSYYYNVYM
ncbi:MAG: hypothetical protein E7259_04715 [Lachnospiraceae bacterium]|nr:hypothetical protein [Lachnospiraceae bacterium]